MILKLAAVEELKAKDKGVYRYFDCIMTLKCTAIPNYGEVGCNVCNDIIMYCIYLVF